MLFGLPEMKVFAETSSDPRIKALWSRLEEARKKNALWCEEVNTLRDQLRWRKWPEEKPEYQGQYQAFWDRSEGVFVVNYDPFAQAKWKHCIAPPILWRPIGPLPGGE